MDKFNDIEEFYKIILAIEDIKREDWVIRNLSAEKLEAVSNHTLQVILLAFKIIEKMNLDFNLIELAQMYFVHDIGKAIIKKNMDSNDSKFKKKKNIDIIEDIMSSLPNNIKLLYIEYWLQMETKVTKAGSFLYEVDKLEILLRAKHYAEKYKMTELYREIYENEITNAAFSGNLLEEMFTSLDPDNINKSRNS